MPHFSNSWFAGQKRYWNQLLSTHSVTKYLEIGSYEGQSTLGVANMFPYSNITCVDTWEGENQGSVNDNYALVKSRFDQNIQEVKHRVTIFHMPSAQALPKLLTQNEKFDLIYVDGSHHSADVLFDAVNAFHLLNVGGIMIFDDYEWNHFKEMHLLHQNPKFAIDSFLCSFCDELKILHKGWQVFVQKVKGR